MAGGSVDKLAATRQEAEEWVRRLCGAVRQAVEADRVIVWLYDAARQAAVPLAADDPSVLEHLLPQWETAPLARMPAAVAALLEGRPVEIQDAQNDERISAELAADLGMSSVRFEPLIVGTPVGMLSIEPAPRGASPELHSLLATVAAAVARIASTLEGDRERVESAFLLELTESAVKAPSLEDMLTTICERTASQLRAQRATILLHDDGRLVPRASRYADGSRDIGEWEAMRRAPNPLPAAQAALDSGEPVVASGAGSPLIGSWGASGFEVQAVLAVPLGDFGVLVLDDSEPASFSAEDVRLASAAAAHVAPAIDQAKTSDERTSHLRAATAVRRLLEEGTRAASVEEAGEALAKITREAIGCETATVLLRAEDDTIEYVSTVGADGEFEATLRERLGDLPAGDFRLWRITARQAKPIFVENAHASRLLPLELVEGLALKSYVALPLLSATRPLGLVLCTHSRAPRPWSNEERQLVDQLALEGSLVVENAMLRATDQERLDQLAHQAFHDSLTELPNRALFADRLDHALERTNRRKAAVAVLFLDLDEFKPINDNLGHDAGDELLVAVGQRVKACVRPEDTVARLGGDEFTVLLEDIADVRYAIAVAERIEASLASPFVVNDNEVSVTASIGIAVSTGRESTPADLLRSSDRAMYVAKRKGRARHELFQDAAPEHEPGEDGTGPGEEPVSPGEIVATIGEEASAEAQTPPEVQTPAVPEAPGEAETPAEETTPAEEAQVTEEPRPADTDRAVQEIAEEMSIEEPLVAERTAEPPEPGTAVPPEPVAAEPPEPVTAEPPEHPEAEPDEGAASLTEARRRRRRRFPPRRLR
jgi:diguanylate cyclase (GGDEF)-like protein